MSKIGDKAPDFTLQDQFERTFTLSVALRLNPVVLFFYPSDYTPICTIEAIAFRESYADFEAYGADVVGISSNSTSMHRTFCSQLKLPFKLLSDEHHRVRDAFNVQGAFSKHASRMTVVIDQNQLIRWIYPASFRPTQHSKQALEVVKNMAIKAHTA